MTPPLCNATVPCGQDPLLLSRSDYACVSRPAVKLKNQDQAKLRDLSDQHHPNILVPQQQGDRTEPPVPTVCVGGGNPIRVLACGAAMLQYHRATVNPKFDGGNLTKDLAHGWYCTRKISSTFFASFFSAFKNVNISGQFGNL